MSRATGPTSSASPAANVDAWPEEGAAADAWEEGDEPMADVPEQDNWIALPGDDDYKEPGS